MSPRTPSRLGDLHSDGDTLVFTTPSCARVFQAGEQIQTRHTAALTAMDLSTVWFSRDTSERWLRQRLGFAAHSTNFAIVLMAAVTPPARACLKTDPEADEFFVLSLGGPSLSEVSVLT